MVTNPTSDNERARLDDLLSYNLLDSPREEELDEIVALASEICNMPISLISLIDEKRQWIKARVGLDIDETPREYAFCAHAIHGADLMMVPDALQDERFQHNPLVTGEPGIRFYAGVPLTSNKGHNLGTLCVIDQNPRELSAAQERALRTLAKQVVARFELRKKNATLQSVLQTIDAQNEQLENRNQMLTRLISIISHDLRNPIENLKQLFEMFINGELDTEEFKLLGNDVNKSLSSTTDLLNNLLSWAGSQLSGSGITISRVALRELINGQIVAIEPFATSKNNKLINEVQAGTYLNADADMLQFIIRNLVANANKFTKNGTIRVALRDQEGVYEIAVADTGMGISEAKLSKLLNWKNRQTALGTDGEKGSGLGLLIAEQFARQLGGRLFINSEEGKGTTVYVEIAKDLEFAPRDAEK